MTNTEVRIHGTQAIERIDVGDETMLAGYLDGLIAQLQAWQKMTSHLTKVRLEVDADTVREYGNERIQVAVALVGVRKATAAERRNAKALDEARALAYEEQERETLRKLQAKYPN